MHTLTLKKGPAFLCALLALTLLTGGCAPQAAAEYRKLQKNYFGLFDTMIVIMGYALEEETFERVADEAYDRLARYHQVFDMYNAYEGVANLYTLNRDGGKGPVEVEPELIDLLLFCRERQPLTHGTVNVALGAVLQLWHAYRDAGQYDPNTAELPPMDALTAAAGHVNFDDVIIDEAAGTVAFADPALRLDVGAVAKGYATEQVGQWMLTSDMPSFLISAGGNVYTGNPPLDGRASWGIIVQDPDGSVFAEDGSDLLEVLYVANRSVVTSGDYQRLYVVDGVRYHHLIDPDTLMPATHHRSVTVVCDDSGWADMLSTALFLMPYAEGRAFADSLEGVEVFWMLNDGNRTVEMTDGMRAIAASEGATAY